MITKQDIQKVMRQLSLLSVKDSQFPKLKEADEEVEIPVLHESANKTLTIDKLTKYVEANVDITKVKVPLKIEGFTSETLDDLLLEIYQKASQTGGGGGGGQTTPIDASNVTYAWDVDSKRILTVRGVLDHLIGVLYGYPGYTFPGLATKVQIENMVTANATNATN